MGSKYIGMEAALHARDKVGVQDFVLLEDYNNPDAFLENLKKRFRGNLIYTYIGPVLVSVNPYKQIDNLYNDTVVQTYRNVNFYELPPHIYAIGDSAYRSMRSGYRDQCVLISGESGAGKTEASKKILQYIAASSTHAQDVDRVKDRLLKSNPILEAFGNAKTNRNDNSSRFGKYMDIQFDFKGAPVGGVILNYLLEKSRVVHQTPGERNFHIFYQVVKGNDQASLDKLRLSGRVEDYYYLNQGGCTAVESVDDIKDHKVVKQALEVCDFSPEERDALYSIVAFVLHLGNVGFTEDEGVSAVHSIKPVENMSRLVGATKEELVFSLTNRSILANRQKVSSPLNRDQAVYVRDALAKAVYERLFSWLVQKINDSLKQGDYQQKTVLGLLDIYGFEIFKTNSFEQFCINFCNEKLQQLFIELTLKSEQEEYQSEGIEWEPVQYFNNKIICDLVEAKPIGIISLMDEECLRPGDATDATFLEKLSKNLGGHPHFMSYSTADTATRKTIERTDFRLLHYAGHVTYSTDGFLDKNNDLLYRDLKEVMSNTSNLICNKCFPKSDLNSKKRPDTAGTQFKQSLAQLMDILMSKEPSYIRCIKPNDDKRPMIFNDQNVTHQIQYLGLMENLRVRRAGFAYRRLYETFLQRYKPLCPDTWPNFHGPAKEGVRKICKHMQYEEDSYRMGHTKLFIRFPRVLFATEDALQERKHGLATMIQAQYRGHWQRQVFLKQRAAVTMIACYWRRYTAKKLLERRRKAAHEIRRFIKGFILRKNPPCEENMIFIGHMRYNYLMRLKKALPKTVLDKSWPRPPELLQGVSEDLRELNMKNMVLRYCKSITPDTKWQFEQKVMAESVFKGKKQSYPQSIRDAFVDNRLATHHESLLNNQFKLNVKTPGEIIKYSAIMVKYDRNGYHPRNRAIIVTTEALYMLNEKDFKLKERIPFTSLKGVSVSSFSDGIFVVHSNPELNNCKGDLILQTDYLYEAVIKLAMNANLIGAITITDTSITHQLHNGKSGVIDFMSGMKYNVAKGKNGHLAVVTPVVS